MLMKKIICVLFLIIFSLGSQAQVKRVELKIAQSGLDSCLSIVENTFDKDVIKIGPNPCAGLVSINYSNPGISCDVEISILDIQGKKVFEETVPSQQTFTRSIDIARESAGVYLIRITGNKKVYISQIIKK
jgi:hypothetical protein